MALAASFILRTIAKTGKESRLIFKLDAPYGSIELHPGADPNSVAAIQLSDDDATKSPQWSYGIVGKDVGVLHIGIGTDEGSLSKPDFVWRASSPSGMFVTARGGAPESDLGRYMSHNVALNSNNNVAKNAAAPGTKIYVTRDLPMDFSANLGFGESILDLTRLPLTNVYIETGASRATIYANEPNPQTMGNCTVKAGLGECTFSGISNLNAKHFHFNGGVGSYRLGFEGRLTQNMDATVDVGIAKCTILIPPLTARVQVFYDDGMFSSYAFNGLAIRRSGYATSPGFDHSNAPILTLHLSSAAGKIAVNYH